MTPEINRIHHGDAIPVPGAEAGIGTDAVGDPLDGIGIVDAAIQAQGEGK